MDITQMDGRTLTLLGSGLCTMASVHFTTQLVSQHLFYWKNPAQQRLIIVIVCMAPVYALTSFFGLAEIKGSEVLFTVLESIKECYEALVIACFLSLLYGYAGVSTSKKQIPDGIKGRIIHHSFPVTLFVVMMLSSTIHPPFSFFSVQRLCMNSLLNRSLLNGFSHFCPRCSCFSFYTWLKLVSNLIITPSEGWNEFHLPKKLFDLFCVFFCFVGYHSQRKQNLTRSH
jgi:hypothetical protein